MIVKYNDIIFDSSSILSCSIVEEKAPIAETLSANSMSINVNTLQSAEVFETADEVQFATSDYQLFYVTDSTPELLDSYVYGTPIYVYDDNWNLRYKMFVKSIERISRTGYKINCTSLIGILIGITHRGGMYGSAAEESQNDTAGSIIQEIMNAAGISSAYYSIDNQLYLVSMYGYLPYSDCRNNLQQVLFACNASCIYDNSYNAIFKFQEPKTAKALTGVYLGSGSIKYLTPATKVTVIEHTYYKDKTGDLKTLYSGDSSDVDHLEVIFKNPCHGLTTSGDLTIDESGANYMVVSGMGSVTGYEYLHVTNTLSTDVDVESHDTKEYSVTDATLVNALNSNNVLERMADYYKRPTELTLSMVVDGENPGDLVTFTHPVTMEESSGYIASMDINVSATNKSKSKIITGWTPKYFGNSFSQSDVRYDDSTTWVAQKNGLIRVVLIGGGQGGQGGGNGTRGSDTVIYYDNYNKICAPSGTPGKAGEGGAGGNVYFFDITVKKGDVLTFSFGAGGAGGAAGGGEGALGGATTVTINGTQYTSDSGAAITLGYTDIFTGITYGMSGWAGLDGLDFNPNKDSNRGVSPDLWYIHTDPYGGSPTSDGSQTEYYEEFQVWYDGTKGNITMRSGGMHHDSWCIPYQINDDPAICAFAGCPGGGAFGYSKGGNSPNEVTGHVGTRQGHSYVETTAGNGGDGASATSFEDMFSDTYINRIQYGQGGVGGSGGGSGGGAGNGWKVSDSYNGTYLYIIDGSGGAGGSGAAGSRGKAGMAIIYS